MKLQNLAKQKHMQGSLVLELVSSPLDTGNRNHDQRGFSDPHKRLQLTCCHVNPGPLFKSPCNLCFRQIFPGAACISRMAAAALRSVLRCVLPSLLLTSPPQIRCSAKAAFVSVVQCREVAERMRSCSRQSLGASRLRGIELPGVLEEDFRPGQVLDVQKPRLCQCSAIEVMSG